MIFTDDMYKDFLSELKQAISQSENEAFNGRSSWCAENFENAKQSRIALLEINIEELNSFQNNPNSVLDKDTYETLLDFQEEELHEIKIKGEDLIDEELEDYNKSNNEYIETIQKYIQELHNSQK